MVSLIIMLFPWATHFSITSAIKTLVESFESNCDLWTDTMSRRWIRTISQHRNPIDSYDNLNATTTFVDAQGIHFPSQDTDVSSWISIFPIHCLKIKDHSRAQCDLVPRRVSMEHRKGKEGFCYNHEVVIILVKRWGRSHPLPSRCCSSSPSDLWFGLMVDTVIAALWGRQDDSSSGSGFVERGGDCYWPWKLIQTDLI